MSGEKYAQTRLAAEREAALQHQGTTAARLVQAQTESTRRTHEYRAFKDEYGADAADYMATEFAACEAAHAGMREAAASVESLAQEARGLSLGRQEADVKAFEGALTSIDQAASGPARTQRESADALDRGMESIRRDLQSRMDEAERERRVQADRHTRLQALRDTLAEQVMIDPALAWVSREVTGLLDATTDPLSLEEEDVADLAQRIDSVRREAWERELRTRRQEHVADLLRDALADAGFAKKQDVWVQEAGAEEIHLVHEASEAELFVRVSTAIPEDRSIRLLMEGAAGSDREHLAPAPYCGDSLDAVIARAKVLGLLIEGVHIKGPDGLWRSLETADEAERRRLADIDAATEAAQLQAAQATAGGSR